MFIKFVFAIKQCVLGCIRNKDNGNLYNVEVFISPEIIHLTSGFANNIIIMF